MRASAQMRAAGPVPGACASRARPPQHRARHSSSARASPCRRAAAAVPIRRRCAPSRGQPWPGEQDRQRHSGLPKTWALMAGRAGHRQSWCAAVLGRGGRARRLVCRAWTSRAVEPDSSIARRPRRSAGDGESTLDGVARQAGSGKTLLCRRAMCCPVGLNCWSSPTHRPWTAGCGLAVRLRLGTDGVSTVMGMAQSSCRVDGVL